MPACGPRDEKASKSEREKRKERAPVPEADAIQGRAAARRHLRPAVSLFSGSTSAENLNPHGSDIWARPRGRPERGRRAPVRAPKGRDSGGAAASHATEAAQQAPSTLRRRQVHARPQLSRRQKRSANEYGRARQEVPPEKRRTSTGIGNTLRQRGKEKHTWPAGVAKTRRTAPAYDHLQPRT